MQSEKRHIDGIDGVKIKVDGLQNERDTELLQRQDQNIPDLVCQFVGLRRQMNLPAGWRPLLALTVSRRLRP